MPDDTPASAPAQEAVSQPDSAVAVATPPAAPRDDAPIAAPALPPQRSRGSRLAGSLMATRSLVSIVVLLVAGIGALIGLLHHSSGGSSTDGTFHTGDCVVVTASSVGNASCGAAHDGRITAVLHDSYSSCPSGSDEYDVTDNTGNLCVDRSDSSH